MTTMAQELAAHPELIYRHTVDEYHEMIANGSILEGEPFELLDGQIVRKIRSATGEDIMTVGIEHAMIVKRLASLSSKFQAFGCHVQSQQPVTLLQRDEPEPDAAIIRGAFEDYSDHHPFAQDILCIIEVADSSLARDRGYKLQLYASNGIPMYVLINLVDRLVEVYTSPLITAGRYAQADQLSHGQTLLLPTATDQTVALPVAQLFMK